MSLLFSDDVLSHESILIRMSVVVLWRHVLTRMLVLAVLAMLAMLFARQERR